MSEQYKYIFDMDGTLYRFDKGREESFSSSRFYTDVRNNAYTLLMDRFGMSRTNAQIEYERIKSAYAGEVSLGVESEYGINRYEYFANTWNLNPENYIEKDSDLPEMIEQMRGRIALLTAAPKIWALSVLSYLDIEAAFEEKLYTGEPNIRKPSTTIFKNIARDFRTAPRNIFSIGDQEASDISPAKKIGMKAVLIGRSATTSADYQATDVKSAIKLLRKEGYT